MRIGSARLSLCLLLFLVALPGSLRAQPARLLSLNIRYDNPGDMENAWEHRKNKMIDLFVHYEPALIGIQEGLLHQVEFINESLPEYKYIGVGREDGMLRGEFCALYYDTTRLMLIRDSTFWLSETPEKVSRGWDAALERICTYGIFKFRGSKKRIWVLNTHFDHRGANAREKSAELLIGHIRRINPEGLPLVLMGDLNATPEEKPIQVLRSELQDAKEISVKAFYGPPGTFVGFSDTIMDRRIDYFFVHNLKVLKYSHLDDRRDNNLHISDHLPVLIAIK